MSSIDVTPYLIETGDTKDLVDKINAGLQGFAAVVSNEIAIGTVPAVDIDVSTSDYFQDSISSNVTYTFSNPPASKATSFTLELTISSSAVPTWPTTVVWPYDQTPTLDSGVVHLLSFVWNGSRWFGGVLYNYPLPA